MEDVLTKVTYEGYLNKWILPRWGRYSLARINAGEVELWLRSLTLARGELRQDQGEVGHVVIVQELGLERFDVFLRTAVLEANIVVHASVIDESVKTIQFADCVINRGVTGFR